MTSHDHDSLIVIHLLSVIVIHCQIWSFIVIYCHLLSVIVVYLLSSIHTCPWAANGFLRFVFTWLFYVILLLLFVRLFVRRYLWGVLVCLFFINLLM